MNKPKSDEILDLHASIKLIQHELNALALEDGPTLVKSALLRAAVQLKAVDRALIAAEAFQRTKELK